MAEEKKEGEVKKKKLVKGRHLSSIKRNRQTIKRTERNRATISEIRTAIKKVRETAAKKELEAAKKALQKAMSLLHKAGRKRVIHPKNASRHIARLSKLIDKAGK